MRALVAEDDVDIAMQIASALQESGYVVDVCHDGETGWFMGDTEDYDCVILDLGLPKKDGLSVLADWRQNDNSVPVLILTARDTWREKVLGLRSGADDYLAKPFEMEEMLARVEVLIRRAAGHARPTIKCGPLELNPAQKKVTLNGSLVDLSGLEYRAVAYMILNQGNVISKSELNEHLYGHNDEFDSNVIEVLINRCRNKVGRTLIKTLRGKGYVLEA